MTTTVGDFFTAIAPFILSIGASIRQHDDTADHPARRGRCTRVRSYKGGPTMGTRLLLVVLVALASRPSAILGQENRDANLFRWNGQRWTPVDCWGVRVAL